MVEERPQLRVLSQGHTQIGLDSAVKLVRGQILDLIVAGVGEDAPVDGIGLVRCDESRG